MKAIVFTEYGSADVLALCDVDKPTPKPNEVLVKTFAASTNPADWHTMRGKPFVARLVNGLFKPKNTRLGADIAGKVEAIGNNVTEFKVGDKVFGCMDFSNFGTFAEYVCAPEDTFALMPDTLNFEQAAAVPLAAFTALQGLRDKGHIKKGQKVLVNGASGGVGTFAIQIARSYGAEVTGVCSTPNLRMVSSIGADHVIDYTKEDFTKNGQQYDLIFDAVGNRTVLDYKRALNNGGICSIAGFTTLPLLFQSVFLGAIVSLTGSRKVGRMKTANPNKKDLVFIKQLIDHNKIAPIIDRIYPLIETPEAIRYIEGGHAKGKVIIKVRH